MTIRIRGASQNNLQSVDVDIGEGLTLVTGVSGSGKSSLVYDTLYHEARRRFMSVFAPTASDFHLAPSKLKSITGLAPAVAVGQNLLNRNPRSTVATATGLHPLLRLLYAKFGERNCAGCDFPVSVLSEDEIIQRVRLAPTLPADLSAVLMKGVAGSHRTLLRMLVQAFDQVTLRVDGEPGVEKRLDPLKPHDIEVVLMRVTSKTGAGQIREVLRRAAELGAASVALRSPTQAGELLLSRDAVCARCGLGFEPALPVHFNTPCPECEGDGCAACGETGLLPAAASVRWHGMRFTELLRNSVEAAHALFAGSELGAVAPRLLSEITRRLEALERVGLDYLSLDRSVPTLSRGESQRVRLAGAMMSRLKDMVHILDEPTIGLHAGDVERLISAFKELGGPVVYVEHDRLAAVGADRVIDIGPLAGRDGGRVIFDGPPAELWQADTPTGRYFSLRSRPLMPPARSAPTAFLEVKQAWLRNLDSIDVAVPLERLTAVTGVSGSGKSTLVEDVIAASLAGKGPVGCSEIKGSALKVVMVDQSPIGNNPRSNPATYTKLADVLRDAFAAATGLTASHFSFNRPEGACPSCNGVGATEVKMRFLPSTWLTCSDCDGDRFSEEVLRARARFGPRELSIAEALKLSASELVPVIEAAKWLPKAARASASRLLQALVDIGLGYLPLGQPSPSLSGGEAQRVKLARYLGAKTAAKHLLILDEPTTGLHPADVSGLLVVLNRLVEAGATVLVVEHDLDLIRACDWVIDLGPGAGPNGGRLLYQGLLEGLRGKPSATARALEAETEVRPRGSRSAASHSDAFIRIRGASANNLRAVDVNIPKNALTVVTGVSGSGKSSLVGDVLEMEARRRYLESLSSYERQAATEGPEARVESVEGLGLTISLSNHRKYARRVTVGTLTEISHHLAVLLAAVGLRDCPSCGEEVEWRQRNQCARCGQGLRVLEPRHFFSSTYSAACTKCHGVGTLRAPNPDKAIRNPDKPICGGAMYSPGFFPKGYLCKPFNTAYYEVRALAHKYGFDPERTPWSEMSPEARRAFLFGDPELMEVVYQNPKGKVTTRQKGFPGFYSWVGDWDVGGTYTDTQNCPRCGGAGFREEFLNVRFAGCNVHEFHILSVEQLASRLESVSPEPGWTDEAARSLETALSRLSFLRQVGLSYAHLDRTAASLSAGEAQRVSLAGMLGSELTALTILVDEPTRGLHPTEIAALMSAFTQLRDAGNTVILVEHDLEVIRQADHVIDIGPGAGREGGRVVAAGTPAEVVKSGSLTGLWLGGRETWARPGLRRQPGEWMWIRGAAENNLKKIDVRIPKKCLVGVCGVSGSGKSTLIVDTLGRVVAPMKYTTSVAKEPIEPGKHDRLENVPQRAVLVDQTRASVSSPLNYLELEGPLQTLFADSEDARALGLDAEALARRCSVCKGSGQMELDMEFLPDIVTPCESCDATGYTLEAWGVHYRGLAFPEVSALTIAEALEKFGDMESVSSKLQAACAVGLGYLVLRQPSSSLSGGEAQRLKIARELSRKTGDGALYILDEPTLGLHMNDVKTLASVLHRLVDAGHSVIIVEHNAHLLAECDWLIELGPTGGPEGGYLVAEGTPEDVARKRSPTAGFIASVLDKANRRPVK
jgi:excinuclease ABC subunit A